MASEINSAIDVNAKNIIRRIKKDPLFGLLDKLLTKYQFENYLTNSISLYKEERLHYLLSCERLLEGMSLNRRFNSGPRYMMRSYRTYTRAQRRLVKNFYRSSKYFLLDYYNFLIHANILLNRVTRLSQFFIKSKNISFGSFEKHKRQFCSSHIKFDQEDKEYRNHILENTEWFDGLRIGRNALSEHAAEGYFTFLGQKFSNDDVEVVSFKMSKDDLSRVENIIEINGARLISDIDNFLEFFNEFGSSKL